MDEKNGGTAFPVVGGILVRHGMSLRDYFAAHALQGMLASYAGVQTRLPVADSFAQEAYKHADAMLQARED